MTSSDSEDELPLSVLRERKRMRLEKQKSDTQNLKGLQQQDSKKTDSQSVQKNRKRPLKADTENSQSDNLDSLGDAVGDGDREYRLESRNESIKEEEPEKRSPRKRRRVAVDKSRGDSEMNCPHCNKEFRSENRLRNHIQRYVCRPELKSARLPSKSIQSEDPSGGEEKLPKQINTCTGKRPHHVASKVDDEESNSDWDEEKPAKKGRKRKTKGAGKYKRIRGSLENRTCPDCKRVFTSTLGCQYHVQHQVCKSGTIVTNQPTPFHCLLPGSKFVTAYGVVQVVKDDRAEPKTEFSNESKEHRRRIAKNWRSAMSKYEAHCKRVFTGVAISSLLRRRSFGRLYQQEKVSSSGVEKAYSGRPDINAMLRREFPLRRRSEAPPDPCAPSELCPDRIVECVLTREDNFLGRDGGAFIHEISKPTNVRLFLRRRLLSEVFTPKAEYCSCPHCGRRFASRQSRSAHLSGPACIVKKKAASEDALSRRQFIEQRTEYLSALPEVRVTVPPKKRERMMYPEVAIALGFKFMPKGGKTKPRLWDVNHKPVKDDTAVGLQEPRTLVEELRKTLDAATDERLGCMYPEVFKSLGFRRPPMPKAKKKRQANDKPDKAKTKTVEKAKKPKPPPPLPPIIDVRVLASEVDAGRYPSVQRYSIGEHQDQCFICRKGGTLYCCDFCDKVVHMRCMLTKFTIKEPEPEDDFMCHRCIQKIMARRARAEKRRLGKHRAAETTAPKLPPAEAVSATEIPEGMEYDFVAAQGREVGDLIHLLQDAQSRLQQSLDTAKINAVRRRMMEL